MAENEGAMYPIYIGLPIKEAVYVGMNSPVAVKYVGMHPAIQEAQEAPVSPAWSAVPKDYTEFAQLFAGKIRSQVAGFIGVDREDTDDITQDIIMQFIAGDYLSIYSPERQNQFAEARYLKQLALYEAGELQYSPERFSGKFSSFVFEFTKRRLMGIRDKTNRRVSTMRSLDTFFEMEGDGEDEGSLLAFFGAQDSEFQNIEVRQLLQQAYSHLCSITVATETRNFPELFMKTISDAFEQPEGFDRRAYADSKKITISAVSMQLRELRLYLEQCGFYHNLTTLVASRGRPSVSY